MSQFTSSLHPYLLQHSLDHITRTSGVPSWIETLDRQVLARSTPLHAETLAPLSSLPWGDGELTCEDGVCHRYCIPIQQQGAPVAYLLLGDYILSDSLNDRLTEEATWQAYARLRNCGPDEAKIQVSRLPHIPQEKLDQAVEEARAEIRYLLELSEQLAAAQTTPQDVNALELRLRSIFNGVQDGILIENRHGDIIDANAAVCRMLGYTYDEITRMHVKDLAPDRPLIFFGETRVFDSPIETFDRRKDGSAVPVELTARTWEYHGEEFLLVVVRDISARKQAEESIRISQERLEMALEATEAGFWDWDITTGYCYFSPRWFTMLGYRPDDLPPTLDTWRGLLHPQDAVRTSYMLEQHIAGKRPFFEAEFRMRTKDGSWRWIFARGKVVRRDAKGAPQRMTSTQIDVTLRKSSETALRVSEEKFYKAFQISPDAISISRFADAVYLDINDVFVSLTGYSREEILGKSSATLSIWAYDVEREVFLRQLAQNGEVLGLEASFRTKNGKLIVGLVAARLIDLENSPCVLTIVRDITERKQTEYLLHDAHVRLKWAYEATLQGWNKALEMRDVSSRRHSDKFIELTLRLAQTAGILDDDELTFIHYGAILHDIGKLAIPDMILNKPGPLNSEEWGVIRRHPLYAQEMLQGIDYLNPVLPLVSSHHERWDGNGYPLGLEGEEIPLSARIFAIVDVWDAMTTAKPYRPALSEDQAREYIRTNAGLHFDPKLVDLFLLLVEE